MERGRAVVVTRRMTLQAAQAQLKARGEIERYELFLQLYRDEGEEGWKLLESMLVGEDRLIKMLLVQYLEDIPENRAVSGILLALQDHNRVIREAASRAYEKNPYRKKYRLLRACLKNSNSSIVRFAIQTLSSHGDMEILPQLLLMLSEAEEDVVNEILRALRFLPHPRSIPPLVSYAQSSVEQTRYQAIKSLSWLLWQGESLPVSVFMKGVHDSSERIRQVSILALERYPNRMTAELFLKEARFGASPQARRSAIMALASYPSENWVAPLMELLVLEGSQPIRLSVEITLKRFPAKMLRRGLKPLLSHPEKELRLRSALLAAETLGSDPEIRRRLIALWHEAREAEDKLALMDVLRELGGDDIYPLLYTVMEESPLLAYAAAGVLNRLWSAGSGLRILSLLMEPNLSHHAKQAMLSAVAKRGPEEMVRPQLFPWLVRNLEDSVTNTRYLCLLALRWYPLPDVLGPILHLLPREADETVRQSAVDIILKGLGRDPTSLLEAVKTIPDAGALVPYLVKILTARTWDRTRAEDILRSLAQEPLDLAERRPEDFFAVALHLLRDQAISLETICAFFGPSLRKRFFVFLNSDGKAGPLPQLPIDFLDRELGKGNPEDRALLYGLIGTAKRPESIPYLTARLLKEEDPACLEEGRASLRRLIWGRQ